MRNCSSWCSSEHIPDTSSSSFDSEVEDVDDDDAASPVPSSGCSGVFRAAPVEGDDEEDDDAKAGVALKKEGEEEEEDSVSSSPSSVSDGENEPYFKMVNETELQLSSSYYIVID